MRLRFGPCQVRLRGRELELHLRLRLSLPVALWQGVPDEQLLPVQRADVPCPLTASELQVIHWAARGLTNRQIGRELGIEETTVKTHVHRAGQRILAKGRAQIVAIALRNRWVE